MRRDHAESQRLWEHHLDDVTSQSLSVEFHPFSAHRVQIFCLSRQRQGIPERCPSRLRRDEGFQLDLRVMVLSLCCDYNPHQWRESHLDSSFSVG
jgi:hypothetical protein